MSDRTEQSDTDRRLATLFHEASPDHAPDVADLVKGGVDRGRTRHHRRRVGTALAAAAVVGVIGTAASVIPDLGGGGADYAPAGNGGSSAQVRPSGAKPTSPAADPKAKSQPSGRMGAATADLPVKAADLPRGFTKLYPGKITPAEERTGRIIDNGRESQFAHFRWNGFTTSVGFAAYLGTPAERCAELTDSGSGQDLNCQPRPDGTVLLTWRFIAPARDGGGKSQGASLFTKDGYEIAVISYNQGTKEGRPRADKPPFTIAQLTAAATSDIWFK